MILMFQMHSPHQVLFLLPAAKIKNLVVLFLGLLVHTWEHLKNLRKWRFIENVHTHFFIIRLQLAKCLHIFQ